MEKFGYILLNKPSGPTSHDMVDELRKITGTRKIGHAGTLDPFASGLLIMAIGRGATKNMSSFVKLDKKYRALVCFGRETDTHDLCGRTTKQYEGDELDKKTVGEALRRFVGEQGQVPPMHSAKKIRGQKLYNLARRGEKVDRPPIRVNIFGLKAREYAWPHLDLEIHCSSGTYIRSLARDLGRRLGVYAYLKELKRTAIGPYEIKDSVKISELGPDNWHERSVSYLGPRT